MTDTHDAGGPIGPPECRVPSPSLPPSSIPPPYRLRPSLRAVLLAFLVHHNPFYLLRRLCMIAGCYALNGPGLQRGEFGRVLILVGTLNRTSCC